MSSILSKYAENQQRREVNKDVISRIDSITNVAKESSTKDRDVKATDMHSKKNGILDGDDPLMEIIELTGENGGDKKDCKRGKTFFISSFMYKKYIGDFDKYT